jgi:hypothetical protein
MYPKTQKGCYKICKLHYQEEKEEEGQKKELKTLKREKKFFWYGEYFIISTEINSRKSQP